MTTRVREPNPFPSETQFRRLDWRPGKRRRSKPRVKPYGGAKAANLAFLANSGSVAGFGSGKQKRCRHCGRFAFKASGLCRWHGGAPRDGSYLPRRLKEARQRLSPVER